MKKTWFLAATVLLAVLWLNPTQAQSKLAYVDMDKVLKAIPAYESAQKELEQQAEVWRQEIAKEYDKIDQLFRDYQAREVLLSDADRKEKQDAIALKEKDVRELQKKRFGPDGELFQKRQSLVKPIQEKVYTTIRKLAEERSIDFIMGAPDGGSMIYAKPDKDVTDEVIKRVNK